MTRVSNEPLREAFRASERSAVDVCRAMGWWRNHPATSRRRARSVPDTLLLRRVLGLIEHTDGRGRKCRHETVDVGRACELCDSLGLDFVALYPSEASGPACRECGESLYDPTSEVCGFCEAEGSVAA
jgi:hypothetical protein